MGDTTLVLEIDGQAVDTDGLTALVEIVAEEAADEADAATLVARVEPGDDGEWTSLLDPLTTPRTPVVVAISRDGVTYRFDGLSAEASWQLDAAGASQLAVKAVDRTLDMDMEEKVVAWPGTSDSGIASAIFAAHGLEAQVDDTPPGPDPDVHVAIQRGTDWAFLRALAAKWGYSTFVESDGTRLVGHFRALDPLADPQGTLALGFGGDAAQVSVQADLTAGQRFVARRIPPLSDTAQEGDGAGDDHAQGPTSLGGQATALVGPGDVTGEIDPQEAATGMARRAAFAATLTAELDADATGQLVRARRTILVKGVGSALSGRYLVQRVRHRVTLAGHRQRLVLVRNALGLNGDEPFDGDGLAVLAGAL